MNPSATMSGTMVPRSYPGMFRSVSRSHVGRVRKVNEDRVLDRADRGLWAVADGMGGHRGGDIAAELAIAALRELADAPAPLGEAAILAALTRANAEILGRGVRAGGMIGSTIVVLLILDNEAHVFWAGDSRAYRGREGRWEQVTRDHSLVQELLDQGLIDSEGAARHPQGHVITRALGVENAVQIESVGFPVRAGDTLLLCSDGLSRSLSARALEDLEGLGSESADRLLADTLHRDGSDNISFVIVSTDH